MLKEYKTAIIFSVGIVANAAVIIIGTLSLSSQLDEIRHDMNIRKEELKEIQADIDDMLDKHNG